MEHLETASVHEARMRHNVTYDYMWDYQCDLGNGSSRSEQSFLAKRPVFGGEVQSTEESTATSALQSPQTLEHVKKYLDQCSPPGQSPSHQKSSPGFPRSHTNQSIAGIFIDDEYSGLSASIANQTPSHGGDKVQLAVGVQCDDLPDPSQPLPPTVVCSNCGSTARPVMNTSFCDSMNSSGILSNYNSECSLETPNSLSVASLRSRSNSRSTEETSRSGTVRGVGRVVQWEVTNVEDKKNIYEYVETGLRGDGERTTNIKKVSTGINGRHLHFRATHLPQHCSVRKVVCKREWGGWVYNYSEWIFIKLKLSDATSLVYSS